MPCLCATTSFGFRLARNFALRVKSCHQQHHHRGLNLTTPRRDFHKSFVAHSTSDRRRQGGDFRGAEDRGSFAERLKKMSVQSTVEDLTQICIELRRVVSSVKEESEKEKIVLKHIKAYAEAGVQVNDFAKGQFKCFSINFNQLFLIFLGY